MLVFNARSLLYHSTLGVRVIKKKIKKVGGRGSAPRKPGQCPRIAHPRTTPGPSSCRPV